MGDDRERVLIDATPPVAAKSLRKARKKPRSSTDLLRVILSSVNFYVVELVHLNKLWTLINFLINMKYPVLKLLFLHKKNYFCTNNFQFYVKYEV